MSPPTHNHTPPTGLDALNYPQLTEKGPTTDEYTTHTADGFILASEEEHQIQPSATPTLVGCGPSDQEKGIKDYKIVTFEENDPEDPKNMSLSVKWFKTMLVSFDCFIVALGSSLVVMDFEDAARDLHTNLDVMHLTIAVFVFGFGIGPLILAPLSELYGRAPILKLSMFLYFVFTFPSAFAQNAATMVVGRALAGLGASAPVTVVAGVITDLWHTPDRGLPMAIFSGTLFAGPVVGPVVAGYLVSVGWRWPYYLLLIITGVSFLLNLFFLKETYAPVILKKRAHKLIKETGDETFCTEQERNKRPITEILFESLVRPVQLMLTEPIIVLFTMYLCLIYGLLYYLFFAIPIVFQNIHHFSVGSTGLSFIPVLLGMGVVYATVIPLQGKYYARRTVECVEKGIPTPPEARLPSMMFGSIILPAGFFIFAFTSYEHVHWIGAAFGCGFLGFSIIAIYIGANTYLVDSYPKYASSCMASKTLFTRLVGGAFPMFVDRFYNSAAGPRWASAIMGFISIMMMPIPFLFYRYGPAIRARSKRSSE